MTDLNKRKNKWKNQGRGLEGEEGRGHESSSPSSPLPPLRGDQNHLTFGSLEEMNGLSAPKTVLSLPTTTSAFREAPWADPGQGPRWRKPSIRPATWPNWSRSCSRARQCRPWCCSICTCRACRDSRQLVYLRAHHPELPVCVISANSNPLVIQRAMDHGAAAFIHKSDRRQQDSRGARGRSGRRYLATGHCRCRQQPQTRMTPWSLRGGIGELTPAHQFPGPDDGSPERHAEHSRGVALRSEKDISEATVKSPYDRDFPAKLGVTQSQKPRPYLMAQRLAALEQPEAGSRRI